MLVSVQATGYSRLRVELPGRSIGKQRYRGGYVMFWDTGRGAYLVHHTQFIVDSISGWFKCGVSVCKCAAIEGTFKAKERNEEITLEYIGRGLPEAQLAS